jgi:Tol biopolymer transport system component
MIPRSALLALTVVTSVVAIVGCGGGGGGGGDGGGAPPPSPPPFVAIERVSVASDGTQAMVRGSWGPSISADGRYVAFSSLANDLVPNDFGGMDVFVRDRQAGSTTMASLHSDGNKRSGDSSTAVISADGRYVAFLSVAPLVANDGNFLDDVFVRDRQTGTTTRVSVHSNGTEADARSFPPAISADGRYVVFSSSATNLVDNDTNGVQDAFLHDRQTGATTRVSVDSNGAQLASGGGAPSVSADGRYVAFQSAGGNYLRDRQAGTTTLVSVDSNGVPANGFCAPPAISTDGRYVAFASDATNLVANDTNGVRDVFVHDRQTVATTRVSVDSSGAQANGASGSQAISGDGRYVVFQSDATNLVANDIYGVADIYLRDLQTGTTKRVSVDFSGAQLPGFSGGAAISADGRYVGFDSPGAAVPGDTNGAQDVFLATMY